MCMHSLLWCVTFGYCVTVLCYWFECIILVLEGLILNPILWHHFVSMRLWHHFVSCMRFIVLPAFLFLTVILTLKPFWFMLFLNHCINWPLNTFCSNKRITLLWANVSKALLRSKKRATQLLCNIREVGWYELDNS